MRGADRNREWATEADVINDPKNADSSVLEIVGDYEMHVGVVLFEETKRYTGAD